MRKFFYFCFIITFCLFVISCNDHNCTNQEELTYLKQIFTSPVNNNEGKALSNTIFKIEPCLEVQNKCIFNFQFNYWIKRIDDKPIFSFKGQLMKNNNSIILKSNNASFPLFTFAPKGYKEKVEGYKVYPKVKENDSDKYCKITYLFSVDSIFFSDKYLDTLYKFRFNKIGTVTDSLDLVFTIGKNCGVVNCYDGEIYKSGEVVVSKIGDISMYSNLKEGVIK